MYCMGMFLLTNMSPAWMSAKSLQWCRTLCDPVDCSLPGFSVHRILQARILEWVAMPFSRGSSQPRDWTWVYYVSYIGRWIPLEPTGKPNMSPIHGFPGCSDSKTFAFNAGDVGWIPGSGSSPGGEIIHSSILPRRIPWTEEPGGLQFMGSQRTGYNQVNTHTHTHTHTHTRARAHAHVHNRFFVVFTYSYFLLNSELHEITLLST